MGGKILITRPEAAAEAFLFDVRGLGFDAIAAPMLEIEAVAFDVPDLSLYQGFIFTSANAVRVFCEAVDDDSARDVPAYVVGPKTMAAARAGGFGNVIASGAGDAHGLVEVIASDVKNLDHRLLHVRGVDVAQPVDQLLGARGIIVENLIVYKAQFVDVIADEVLSAIEKHDVQAVLFFSKRTAENFMNLVQKYGVSKSCESIKALCISDGVLEYVQSLGWPVAYACDRPDRGSMLDLLSRICVVG